MKRILSVLIALIARAQTDRPNIILVMADDMGWGQTSYYNHPVLKTPNLDAMAANGLRMDRFYAGAPNCSPTRASVMTGRTNDRGGVRDHGFPLRLQETTIAHVLRQAGYATGHFGKWHLSGFAGPGAPVLADDPRNPGVFGFGTWLSMTNFFDIDPLMSRNGKLEAFRGDSSEIIVAQASAFIKAHAQQKRPFLAVIWYGSPHGPFRALDMDAAPFASLNANSRNHYGELVAMDRSIGSLRNHLRDLGIAGNTLVWFNSDNGGLPGIQPSTTGGLRGYKNTMYEGGLRVPGIIEWPSRIKPRITASPAGTVDIFPTVAEIAGLPASVAQQPADGVSLVPLFTKDPQRRAKPLGFRHSDRIALIDNGWKIVKPVKDAGYELYNLETDPKESADLFARDMQNAARMRQLVEAWNASVEASVAGRDYKEGRLLPGETERRDWLTLDLYKPYLDAWKSRPEYSSYIK